MHMRRLAVAAAVGALAVPALGQAQPNRFTFDMRLDPGERNTFTLGPFPRGEFAFRFRASSDGAKSFTITQQRNGGVRFPVFVTPGSPTAGVCGGAAGSLYCAGITTPVTPRGRTWTIRVRNRDSRPLSMTLTIVWRRVTSAG